MFRRSFFFFEIQEIEQMQLFFEQKNVLGWNEFVCVGHFCEMSSRRLALGRDELRVKCWQQTSVTTFIERTYIFAWFSELNAATFKYDKFYFQFQQKSSRYFFSDRRSCRHFTFRSEKKPSRFCFSGRRNRRHFIFRSEEVVKSLFFGQNKPSTFNFRREEVVNFYFSDRRNLRHLIFGEKKSSTFIFRTEETV
jgi:hypothetical protein